MGCVKVWVYEFVGVCMCVFCNMCVSLCGFLMCGYVWVGFVIFGRVYVERITLTQNNTSVHQKSLN